MFRSRNWKYFKYKPFLFFKQTKSFSLFFKPIFQKVIKFGSLSLVASHVALFKANNSEKENTIITPTKIPSQSQLETPTLEKINAFFKKVEDSRWALVKNDPEFKVYSIVDKLPIFVKSEVKVNAPADYVFSALERLHYSKDYSSDLMELKVVDSYENKEGIFKICVLKSKVQWPCSNRESVFSIEKYKLGPDHYLWLSEDKGKEIPVSEGFVRVCINLGGWEVKRIGPNKTKITSIVHCDPNLALMPHWIFQSMSVENAKGPWKMKQLIEAELNKKNN